MSNAELLQAIESRDIETLWNVVQSDLPFPIRIVVSIQLSRLSQTDLDKLFSSLEGLIHFIQKDPENGFNAWLDNQGIELPNEFRILINAQLDKLK